MVEMPEGNGVIVSHPLKDSASFEARIPMEVDVKDKLSHAMQAVVRIEEVRAFNPECSVTRTCKA